MLGRVFFLVYFIFSLSLFSKNSAFDMELAKSRCLKAQENEPLFYSNDFGWGLSHEAMEAKFNELYNSGKRLARRAFYDNDKEEFFIPVDTVNGYENAKLSEHFIKNITLHIETALERDYVDYIFLPDMGHTHYFIPDDLWKNKYNLYSNEEKKLSYETMMQDAAIKILYHNAEQLKVQDTNQKFLNDPYLQRRYWTRNIVGDNNSQGILEVFFNKEYDDYNTLHKLDGYYYYGGGVYLQASKNACFPYRHGDNVYYFDLSYEDFTIDTNIDPAEFYK